MSNAEDFSTEWEIIQEELNTNESGKNPESSESSGSFDYEIMIGADTEEEKPKTFLQRIRNTVDNYICARILYAMTAFSSAAMAACEPVEGPPCGSTAGYKSECPATSGSEPLSSEMRRLTKAEIRECFAHANNDERHEVPNEIMEFPLEVIVVSKLDPDPDLDPTITDDEIDTLIDGVKTVFIDTGVNLGTNHNENDDGNRFTITRTTYDFSSFEGIENVDGAAALFELAESGPSVKLFIVLDPMPDFTDADQRWTRGFYDYNTRAAFVRIDCDLNIDHMIDRLVHEFGHEFWLRDTQATTDVGICPEGVTGDCLVGPDDTWPNPPDGCEWGGCDWACETDEIYYEEPKPDGLDVMSYWWVDYGEDDVCNKHFSKRAKKHITCVAGKRQGNE